MTAPITTDYTEAGNPNSLTPGPLSGYRLMHWMRDILMNFFSDPINIKDERISKLLCMQNGPSETTLNALFRVGLPYDGDVVKAGTTPCILVSLGESTYPVKTFNMLAGMQTAAIGSQSAYSGMAWKSIGMRIAIVTESYDATVLIGGIIEDFLLMHKQQFVHDNGMISEFAVLGSSAPQKIEVDQAGNAREIYQLVITVNASGGIAWTVDTQGPVFRGITANTQIV